MKRSVPVEIKGATVCFSDENRIAFLLEDLRIAWVDRQREYKAGFPAGSVYWTYLAELTVIATVPQGDAKREDLDSAGTVEVEVKQKRATSL